MSKRDYYHYQEKKTSTTIILIFGLVVFIFLFFPFFGGELKYHLGAMFTKIIDIIGTISLTIGSVFLIIGVIGIFAQSGKWIRNIIVGIALLWVGCWCSGNIINIFGIFTIKGPN
ncbi:MAG: hypothetical protein ACFFCE_19430 [Promethearchaeota archaeon]